MEIPIIETIKKVLINFNSFLSNRNWEDPELFWLMSTGCRAGTGKSSGEGRNGTVGDGGEATGEADATEPAPLEQVCRDILLSNLNTPSMSWHQMEELVVHIFGVMILTLLRKKLLLPPPFETLSTYSGFELGRIEPVEIRWRCSKNNGEGIEW